MLGLESLLQAHARELGFDLVGIAPATTPPGVEALRDWLAKDFAGEMRYMHRHAGACEHPRAVLPEVRSVVMVAMNYKTNSPLSPLGRGVGGEGSGVQDLVHSPLTPALSPEGRGSFSTEDRSQKTEEARRLRGKISSYAWGNDYHDLLRERLNQLLDWVSEQVPECRGRAVVDTTPLLERDFARLAGLGWFGKNTMLLNKRLGSYFFLGALLLDIELQPDAPFETNHCGTCTACLDACPTQAFVGPGVLDARRCISYLTIELRGPIPTGLRQPMGDWVFGCDVCQEICPWNHKAPPSREPGFQPRQGATTLDLIDLLGASSDGFRERFRGTAITRTKRRGLLRNAAIALGNHRDPRAIPALAKALEDEEPLVRSAAAWALGRIDTPEARRALETRQAIESDMAVRREIDQALTEISTIALT